MSLRRKLPPKFLLRKAHILSEMVALLKQFAISFRMIPTSYEFVPLWQALFEDAIIPIFVFDDCGRISKVNQSACTLFNVTKEQIPARSINHFFPQIDLKDVQAKLSSTSPSHKITRLYLQQQEKIILVDVSFTKLQIEEKIHYIFQVLDQTESESSDRLLNFFSFAEKNLDYVNDIHSVYQLAINFAGECIGDWSTLYTLRDRVLKQTFTKNTDVKPYELPFDIYDILKSGSAKLINLRTGENADSVIAVPLYEKEKIVGVFVVGKNAIHNPLDEIDLLITEQLVSKITTLIERAETTKELVKMRDLASLANESKTHFLANASHEIRTPLGAILGFVELLSDPLQSSQEKKQWEQKITSNSNHLLRIIDDILDLSKVEAGKLELQIERVDLAALFADIYSTLQPRSAEKNIAVSFTFLNAIPRYINSDVTRLHQILWNVLGNAIKFTEKGSVTLAVTAHVQNNEVELYFQIQDTGPGLSQDQIDRLFKPFSQVETQQHKKYGGTGLGLALAKRFANMLDGDISVLKSEIARGSIFSITIKATLESSTAMNSFDPFFKSEEDNFTALITPRFENLKVLIVDDSLDNQILVKHFLSNPFIQTEFADDGQAGVTKALAGNFDIVLMDLQMPVQDGYSAAQELRDRGYTKPIIALTACAFKEEKGRCISSGFNSYITKPVKKNDLLNLIAEFSRKMPSIS